MECFEPVPSPTPKSGPKWPTTEIFDELRELTVLELSDVQRFVKRIRAARGDRPSPELISRVLVDVAHLHATYAYCVPISLIRARYADVPQTLLEQALFDAEKRDLLRIEPVQHPAPFIEVDAAIPHERGLLYWIVPYQP